FFLGQRTISALSGPAPVLLRPFFDVNNGINNAVVVSFPGLARGELSALAKYQLWGAEANAWCNVCGEGPGQILRAGLIAGFRYADLTGLVQFNQSTQFATNLAGFPAFLPFAGSRQEVFDSFSDRNQYYGAQVGIRVRSLFDWGEFSTTVKYGIGTTHERLTVNGGQVLTAPSGAQTTSVGGLLALPSNIGTRSQNSFAQFPEAHLSIAVRLSRYITIHGR